MKTKAVIPFKKDQFRNTNSGQHAKFRILKQMQGLVAQRHSGEGGLEDSKQMNQKLKGTLQGLAGQFPPMNEEKRADTNWRSS